MPTANSTPIPKTGAGPQHPNVAKQECREEARTNGVGAIGYFQMHLETLEGLVSALYLISARAVEVLGQDESQVGGALEAVVGCVLDKAAELLDDADKMLGDPTWDPIAGKAFEPDTALIATCAEFAAIEARINALCDAPGGTPLEKTVVALEKLLPPILDRLGAQQAKTAAGIHARVRLMATHNGKGCHDWTAENTFAGRLLDYTLRDATALPIGVAGVQS